MILLLVRSKTKYVFQTHFLFKSIDVFDTLVGGGSAGSVLANRLSANEHYSVLLLEAGGNPNPMQTVPAYFTTILHSPPVDYDFYTVPQENACLALKNQVNKTA